MPIPPLTGGFPLINVKMIIYGSAAIHLILIIYLAISQLTVSQKVREKSLTFRQFSTAI